MTASLYLTRAAISRTASARSLIQLLNPASSKERIGAHHRLLWTLFADEPDRGRDFLWREDGEGRFLILSARAPDDRHNLFDLSDAKPFAPDLRAGNRLRFALRANATVRHRGDPRHRDVVMDAIHSIAPGRERAAARTELAQPAARAWLDRQGEAHGFAVEQMACLGYDTVRIAHAARPIQLGVVELDGHIGVVDPVRFLAAIGRGFGRARAFGCGLMLIAPA